MPVSLRAAFLTSMPPTLSSQGLAISETESACAMLITDPTTVRHFYHPEFWHEKRTISATRVISFLGALIVHQSTRCSSTATCILQSLSRSSDSLRKIPHPLVTDTTVFDTSQNVSRMGVGVVFEIWSSSSRCANDCEEGLLGMRSTHVSSFVLLPPFQPSIDTPPPAALF